MMLTSNTHSLAPRPVAVNPGVYQTSPLATAFTHWCAYRIEQDDARSKPTKRPYDPRTGRRAKANTPETFTDLQTVLDRLDQYDGAGLLVEGGMTFLDLDNLLDPADAFNADALPAWVRDLTAATYAEWSPSGTGIHLFYATTVDGYPNKRASTIHPGVTVEQYSNKRFATVTFQPIPGTAQTLSTDPDVLIDALDRAGMPTRDAERTPATTPPRREPARSLATTPTPSAQLEGYRCAGELSDDEVIEKATRSKVGDKIRRLLSGDASGYPSDSEAHLALARYLWFYTGDNWDQLRSLVTGCPLWRDKHHKGTDRLFGYIVERLQSTPLTSFWSEGYRTGITAPVHFRIGPTPEPPTLDVNPNDDRDTLLAKVAAYEAAKERYRAELAARDWLIETEASARKVMGNTALGAVRFTAYALVLDIALRIAAGETPEDRRYRISSTRLAEALGATRKTINTHLSRLKKDGLIDKEEPVEETIREVVDFETGEIITEPVMFKTSYITLPEGGIDALIATLCAGETEVRHGGKRQPRICKVHPHETVIEVRTTYHCPACVAEGRESELQHEYRYIDRNPEDHARQIADERRNDPAFDRYMTRLDRESSLADDERFPGIKINPRRACLSCDAPVPASRKLCPSCEEIFAERDRRQAESHERWRALNDMLAPTETGGAA